MRTVIYLALLLATPAVAQPVTSPAACGATIAYAPDDARTVIEDWLRDEPACTSTLEVRVVPTDGGLYLFARDERGHVRERLVPDAQSAAVLVASWMADDARPPAPSPIVALPRHVPAPAAAPPLERIDGGPSERARPRAGHWLALGPVLVGNGRGARAEIDLYDRGAWTLGAGASVASQAALVQFAEPVGPSSVAVMSVVDTSALAFVTRRFDLGGWQVRPSAGIGFTYTRTSIPMTDATDPWNPYSYSIDDEGIVSTAELALRIGHRIGDSWQIDAGPGVTFLGRGPGVLDRAAQRSLYAAVRYRL